MALTILYVAGNKKFIVDTPRRCVAASPEAWRARWLRVFRGHDWRRNGDLRALRQTGYVPYAERGNPHYQPKPMRVCARSESREALTALSLVLGANCDYNPDSDYPFELMLPFETVAQYMGGAARLREWTQGV